MHRQVIFEFFKLHSGGECKKQLSTVNVSKAPRACSCAFLIWTLINGRILSLLSVVFLFYRFFDFGVVFLGSRPLQWGEEIWTFSR